ncbi:transposase, partial [bacterium]|nr:transposase [bacterium]
KMPRKARIDVENYWYHVISRGQRKNPLFFSNEDMQQYLLILADLLLKFDIILGAFCIMRNHVHLLLFRRNDSLYSFMHLLNTRYANYFNKKYKLVGHVFQGRFLSKIVLDARYLNYLVYYIHKNPQKAGIIKEGEIYQYSSEKFYITGNSDIPIREVPTWEDNLDNGNIHLSEKIEKNIFHENYVGTDKMYKFIEKRKSGREKEKYIERRNKPNMEDEFKKLNIFSLSDLEEMRSSKRSKILVKKRLIFIAYMYKKNYTITEIARFLNKGTTTIYNYIMKGKENNDK